MTGSAAMAAWTSARTSGSSYGSGTDAACGQRRKPGALHGERHRPGHIDDDGTAVGDGGTPHPVRLGRHRRASGRHRASASRPVKASTAGLPSRPIRVGSTISLSLSPRGAVGAPSVAAPSVGTPSVGAPSVAAPWPRTAITGTSSRAAASAVSAACSLPCRSLVGGQRRGQERVGRTAVLRRGTAVRQDSGGPTRDRPYATGRSARSHRWWRRTR